MRELLIVIGIGVGTYALRAAFMVTRRTKPPRPIAGLLPFVGPAVLAAITVPAVLAPTGKLSLAESSAGVLSAIVTWAIWRRRQRLPLALFGGLACWWAATTVLTALATGLPPTSL